jgi:hypothetical protein
MTELCGYDQAEKQADLDNQTKIDNYDPADDLAAVRARADEIMLDCDMIAEIVANNDAVLDAVMELADNKVEASIAATEFNDVLLLAINAKNLCLVLEAAAKAQAAYELKVEI